MSNQSISRRLLVRAGAGLAALAALWPANALAAGDDPSKRGLRGTTGVQDLPAPSLPLVPVGLVKGDFAAINPGNDRLGSGAVGVDAGLLRVSLHGAVPNHYYEVQFERLSDHGREEAGVIHTDGNGDVNDIAGSIDEPRVGTFVVSDPEGHDQFVTCFQPNP